MSGDDRRIEEGWRPEVDKKGMSPSGEAPSKPPPPPPKPADAATSARPPAPPSKSED